MLKTALAGVTADQRGSLSVELLTQDDGLRSSPLKRGWVEFCSVDHSWARLGEHDFAMGGNRRYRFGIRQSTTWRRRALARVMSG